MEKEIELAKSWFVGAQIFAIIAGFFFALGGLGLTNTINILAIQTNTSVSLVNLIKDQMILLGFSTSVGIILTTISVLLWQKGCTALKQIKNT